MKGAYNPSTWNLHGILAALVSPTSLPQPCKRKVAHREHWVQEIFSSETEHALRTSYGKSADVFETSALLLRYVPRGTPGHTSCSSWVPPASPGAGVRLVSTGTRWAPSIPCSHVGCPVTVGSPVRTKDQGAARRWWRNSNYNRHLSSREKKKNKKNKKTSQCEQNWM